jgi:hypothetical protein
VEEQILKHRKQIEDYDNEKATIEKEISKIEDAIAVIQNEH